MNYKNEFLFSDSYLNDIIKKAITDDNLKASLQTIKEWHEYADSSSLEQWISSYIKPTLDTIGFSYQFVNEDINNILFLYQDIDKSKPISICYVVPPNEDIDCTISGNHWAEKIIRNLKNHSFEWGILTDGSNWRIYHTKEPTPYETYLEINLDTIIKKQDYSSFQMFYFFFQPINFVKNENDECKFDDFKEESLKATEYIEENLRDAIEKVEDGVLQTLCLGYINDLKKNTYNTEDRSLIYGGAILYLFRLLFLFYSSARNLLKKETIEIFENIISDSLSYHDRGKMTSTHVNPWLKLQHIFAEIDLTYNGGLFSPYESSLTRFIEENRVAEDFLYKIIFELSYYQKEKGKYIRIEYRDLSVRHLGSLYEGLLEHNLYIAQENMVVRKSGNKIRYIPQSQAGRISRNETIIEKGKVYFSEDSKERKLTGSYYTPEDVVEYIVKNTVDVLLDQRKQEFLKNIEPLFEETRNAINDSEKNRIKEFVKGKFNNFIEENILTISVLDPTMGSGHFLVNATNHIANFIVSFLNEFYDFSISVNSNPMYWRRRVVENCIYGVDLNLLAVELAKLCLWITTAFKEKPLSFLNHHLKQGNALVGIGLSDIRQFLNKSKQEYSNLFSQSYLNIIEEASKTYRQELGKITEARAEIDEKKEILEDLDKKLYSYKKLYDLFTDKLLGKIKDYDFWLTINNWHFSDNYQNNVEINGKNYFHWDLEYPDVFNGVDPGFDCVIGNPPYVEYSKRNIKYVVVGYHTQSCNNLFAYTIENAFNLLRYLGKVGMILPLSAFSTKNMEIFKEFVLSKSKKIYLSFFHFRPAKIFEGANLPVSILISVKGKNDKKEKYTTGIYKWQQDERKHLFKNIKYVKVDPKLIDSYNNFYYPKLKSQIENKIFLKLLKQKPIINYKKAKAELNNSNNIYYRTAGGLYWKVITNFKFPYESTSNKLATIREQYSNKVFVAMLNSNTFWWYYCVTFDTLNLKDYLIFGYRFTYEHLSTNNLNSLNELCDLLMEDYLKNAKHTNRKKTKCLNIYPRKSKAIIDEIDQILGNHYGFNQEEIGYIINYDLKYRMNE